MLERIFRELYDIIKTIVAFAFMVMFLVVLTMYGIVSAIFVLIGLVLLSVVLIFSLDNL